MTSIYRREWNEDTYAYGWPIPRVVFQRKALGEPWLDFVGPTVILAYPMNYVIYTLLPVIALLIFVLSTNKKRGKRIDMG